jgi:zinc transporter, ZIP family
MRRGFWSLVVVLVVVVLLFVIAFAGGFAAMRGISGKSSSGGDVTVDHATLRPGEIVLTLESHSDHVVTVAQAIVNDAYVNFEAGTPGAADIAIDYPWIEGESYEIELLTSKGASVDYEIEEARAT